MSHAYGEDWREVEKLMWRLTELMDHKFFAGEATADARIGSYFNPAMGTKLRQVAEVIEEFRPFVEAHKNMPYRAQTVAYRLLRYFLDYAKGYADFMTIKAFGASDEAKAMCFKFMDEFGKNEIAIERYYDQRNFGAAMNWRILKSKEAPVYLGVF